MRVLVCGRRTYNERDVVWGFLDALHAKSGIAIILNGGARGADRLAMEWAIDHKVPHKSYLANWQVYGHAAGPIRNQRMLNEGKPDLVVAFPGGKGTRDMVRKATAAGVAVVKPDIQAVRE